MTVISNQEQQKPQTEPYEPDLDEEEIDGYITSVPGPPETPRRTPIQEPGQESEKMRANTAAPYTPTPKSTAKKLRKKEMANPRSIGKEDTFSNSTPRSQDHSHPVTPKKNIGWLGTDARRWCSPGSESPWQGSRKN